MLAFGTAEQSARWSHLLGWGGPLQRSPPSQSGVGAACCRGNVGLLHKIFKKDGIIPKNVL